MVFVEELGAPTNCGGGQVLPPPPTPLPKSKSGVEKRPPPEVVGFKKLFGVEEQGSDRRCWPPAPLPPPRVSGGPGGECMEVSCGTLPLLPLLLRRKWNWPLVVTESNRMYRSIIRNSFLVSVAKIDRHKSAHVNKAAWIEELLEGTDSSS